MKKLIKSYSFWTALAGALGLLVVSVGNAFGYTIASKVVEDIVMGVCGILIVFGVVPKPKKQIKNESNDISNSQENETDSDKN